MKALLPAVLSLVMVAQADDFKLVDGTEYKGAKVTRTDADGIQIETDSGVAKIKFASLSADVQKRYGYDAEKIAAEAKRVADAKREADAKVAAEHAAKLAALKDASRIKGPIVQIIPQGLLVESREPVDTFVPSGLQSVGGAFSVGSTSVAPEEVDRTERIFGTFLIVGHPEMKRKVDADWIDVDAVAVGTFSFEDTTGVRRTIKKFKVVNAVK